MIRTLVLGMSAAAAALAFLAGPAHADPKWHMYDSPQICEQERLGDQSRGVSVSASCEYRPGGGFDGGDRWVYWVY